MRTQLDLLKPDLRIKLSNRQMDQTITKGGAASREFSIGQREREREREREHAITLVVQSGYLASSEHNLGPYLTEKKSNLA